MNEGWPKLDLSGSMPDPDILAVLLTQANTHHNVREIGNGVYSHTFTPATKTFIPELWAETLQMTVLNDLLFSIRERKHPKPRKRKGAVWRARMRRKMGYE